MSSPSRSGRFAFAAALALAAPASPAISRDPFLPALAPTGSVRVAVRVLGNNMPLVECEIDGRPCTLLFDTGATYTTIDAGFVRRELKDHKLEKVVLAGETNVTGEPSLVHAASLKVGAAEFSDFDLMVLDLSHLPKGIGEKVDGVLGMNVIGRVITLVSLGSGEAVFRPERESLRDFTNLAERVKADFLSVALKARRGGKTIDLIVDSASSFTFLSADTGWPTTGKELSLGATDVNANGNSLAPLEGEEGELELGIPVKVKPLVVKEPMNRIGADALLRYDVLIGQFGRGAAFRPRQGAASRTAAREKEENR